MVSEAALNNRALPHLNDNWCKWSSSMQWGLSRRGWASMTWPRLVPRSSAEDHSCGDATLDYAESDIDSSAAVPCEPPRCSEEVCLAMQWSAIGVLFCSSFLFSSLVTFVFDHKSLRDTFRSDDLVCWFHFCSSSYRAFHPLSTAPAVQEASIYRHSSDASTVCDWLTWLFIQWNPTQSYQRSLLNKRYANVCLRMKKKESQCIQFNAKNTLRTHTRIHAGSLASVPQYIDWTGLLWHPIIVCVWLQTELLSRARSL